MIWRKALVRSELGPKNARTCQGSGGLEGCSRRELREQRCGVRGGSARNDANRGARDGRMNGSSGGPLS